MKRRLDFVTNSSSSSYTIALYKDKPEIGNTYCFTNMSIDTCNISSLDDLWSYFSYTVRNKLYYEVYHSGMNDELRTKYYQFLFCECFSRTYMLCSNFHPEADIVKECFKEIYYCLNNGYSLTGDNREIPVEYPMIPDEYYDERLQYYYPKYFETYYRQEMLEYLEEVDKTYNTLVKWFENITGCTWVITCSWEDDEPPKGNIMGTKSDDGNAFFQ